MKESIGFIIQARTRSSRLPGKILLPFYKDECILDIIIKKLLNTFDDIPVVVATSNNSGDDEIEKAVKKYPGVKLFRGDEENVLKRFIDAAECYGLTSVIRVCSDNLFTDTELIKLLITYAVGKEWDYVSFTLKGGIPVIKLHQGFYTEWITLDSLKRVSVLTSEKTYQEHVTNYIYTHPELFNVHFEPAPTMLYFFDDLRLTIDTGTDFRNSQFVYKNLVDSKKEISYKNVLEIVMSDEELMNSMRNQIKLNSK